MQQILLTLAAFAVGAVVTSYLTVNTLVSDKVGSPLQANLPYFILAFLTTLALFAWRGQFSDLSKFGEVPWWAFLAGIVGGVAVYGTTMLIGAIGPDRFFVASVAGQLIISVALAHFAWLGVEQDDVTWQKVAGITLALGGALLVTLGGGEQS